MLQTKMNALPELLARAARWLALAAAVLLVAACGPGTGGTGTGPIGGALNFAGSGFSTGVPCPQCDASNLRLEDELVVLTTNCWRFTHTGPWDLDTQGMAVLNGTLETTESVSGTTKPVHIAAVMRLQFSEGQADSKYVVMTLIDLNGKALAPPLTLAQDAVATAPGACAPSL